jgi:hypothetical protein
MHLNIIANGFLMYHGIILETDDFLCLGNNIRLCTEHHGIVVSSLSVYVGGHQLS